MRDRGQTTADLHQRGTEGVAPQLPSTSAELIKLLEQSYPLPELTVSGLAAEEQRIVYAAALARYELAYALGVQWRKQHDGT
jgi:hypothetical protein